MVNQVITFLTQKWLLAIIAALFLFGVFRRVAR